MVDYLVGNSQISNLVFTYYINPGKTLVPAVGVAVGLVISLLPVHRAMYEEKLVMDPSEVTDRILPGYYNDYEKAAPTFFEDYERVNPATSSQGWKNWLDLVQSSDTSQTAIIAQRLEDDREDEDEAIPANFLEQQKLNNIYQRLSDLKMM